MCSAAHDRSILAWAKKVFIYSKLLYELYIASDTKIKLQNARRLFWGYENLCEINLDKWIDSSSVSDMSYMFCGCHSLKKLDVSGLDTSNVVNMEGMFYWCSKLQTLDASYFDTSHVINMKSMFDYCSSLKKLDLSSFCTKHVIDFSSMFGDCIQLEKLVLSGWDTKSAVYMRGMFEKLQKSSHA